MSELNHEQPITIANLSRATPQQVFNQIAKHLLNQSKKSVNVNSDGGEVCVYRSSIGLKCAAGCLIADDEYRTDMEDVRWERLVEIGIAPEAHCHLIETMQVIHDTRQPNEWRECLINLSKSYSWLETPSFLIEQPV